MVVPKFKSPMLAIPIVRVGIESCKPLLAESTRASTIVVVDLADECDRPKLTAFIFPLLGFLAGKGPGDEGRERMEMVDGKTPPLLSGGATFTRTTNQQLLSCVSLSFAEKTNWKAMSCMISSSAYPGFSCLFVCVSCCLLFLWLLVLLWLLLCVR